MVALESAALGLARTIAQKAAAAWLADRRTAEERKKELSVLLAPRLRRTAPEQRFLDEAKDELTALSRHELRGLDDGDRAAALLAVTGAFARADLTDRALFAIDVDAAKLAGQIRAQQPGAKTAAGLGEVGGAFYDAALDRCCALYVRAVAQTPAFVGRSLQEMLRRLSDLPGDVADRVVEALRQAAAVDPLAEADAAVADRVRQLVDERASVLAGRDPARTALDAYVAADATAPLVVRAPAGYGKTTLLAAWTRRPHAATVTVVSHFFAANADLTSLDDACRQLLRQISVTAPALASGLAGGADQSHTALVRAVKAWPDHAEGRLVVVVDALDEARQIPASPIFPLPLPERVSVILSTRSGDESDWLVPNLEAWTSNGTTLELAPLDAGGLRAWLRLTGLADLATEDVAERLAAITAGFPLFVRFLLDDLRIVAQGGGDPREVVRELTARDEGGATRRGGDVPAGFANYVLDQFGRIARSGVPKAVQAMFALVAVAPGPLPEPLVEAGSELTAFDLAALPWSVVRWFTVRASRKEITYAPAHPLLAREFRKRLGRLASEAEEFLLRYCADWRSDATGWALRWYPDLLDRSAAKESLFALARDDAYRRAQLATFPEQPDLALAAGRAAIRHAAAARDVPAVAEFVLRHAREADAMKYARTPLDALRGGSLDEATRRAALFDPQRAPLWTLLLIGELCDTGQAQRARELLASMRINALTYVSEDWLVRAAMVAVSPVVALSSKEVPALCHRMAVADDDSLSSGCVQGLTWLAEHLVDTGRPDVALAVVRPIGPARSNNVRQRIAAGVAEREGLEAALEWLRPLHRSREVTQALAAVAAGRARAGDESGATRMFRRAQKIAEAAGEGRDWALSDLAVGLARAGRFAAASAIIAGIPGSFARSSALEALVTCQVQAGADPAHTLDELGAMAAGHVEAIFGLRFGSALFRAGRTDAAAATFRRLLVAQPDDKRRAEIGAAQVSAGDLDGAYDTLRTVENKSWGMYAERLVRARAEQTGLTAALALVDDLAASGFDTHRAVVGLAEWATDAGDGRTARSLLARVVGARPARLPWDGPADAEALAGIATTLANRGHADEARAVLDLVADRQAITDALPAVAGRLGTQGRLGEAVDLVDQADGEWARGKVLAAIAAGLEENGRHADAVEVLTRTDRIDATNEALERMGCAAARQRRYDDAADCRSRIRTGSISTDPERDAITSAVAVAQCADGDLDAALATTDLLHQARSISACLAGLARACPDPAGLDRIGRRVEALASEFRLAPLVAMAAAHRHAGRPGDARTTLHAALGHLEALRARGEDGRVSWEYDRDRVAAAAAGLALELSRAGLEQDASRVWWTIHASPLLSKAGMRELFLGYARDGQRDLAEKALDAMDDDFGRGEALRLLMCTPQPPPYGDLLVRTAFRIPRRTWTPYLAEALAAAGDWDHLALLLLPAAESLATANAMSANLAIYAPAHGLQLARLIADQGRG